MRCRMRKWVERSQSDDDGQSNEVGRKSARARCCGGGEMVERSRGGLVRCRVRKGWEISKLWEVSTDRRARNFKPGACVAGRDNRRLMQTQMQSIHRSQGQELQSRCVCRRERHSKVDAKANAKFDTFCADALQRGLCPVIAEMGAPH